MKREREPKNFLKNERYIMKKKEKEEEERAKSGKRAEKRNKKKTVQNERTENLLAHRHWNQVARTCMHVHRHSETSTH